MADTQTNPFASYSPEDQAAIRTQLVNLSSSGQLNDAQKRSVALALTQMGAATGFPSQTLPAATPEQPSWWDKANTGLVNPDTILKLAALPITGPMRANIALTKKLGLPVPNVDMSTPTTADLDKLAHGDPSLSPATAALLSGTAGTGADTARTISGFTSPVSIATLAAGPLAKGTGTVGKASRALMAALGLTFGAQGIGNVAEGAGKGLMTPEGAQEALGGLAQVAGAAPAVGELGTAIKGAAQHLVPQAFAEGQNAFIKVLQPDRKVVPAVRDAYNTVAPQLANAPVKDLPDLESFASAQRVNAANQLKAELAKINPQATQIDAVKLSSAIRQQITKAMVLASPGEANAIAQYADRVGGQLGWKPIDLAQAEQLVQQINARVTQFEKMSPAEQRTAAANGDTFAAEKALKNALQEQIEAKLSGYKDLKAQYGAWKEIQNQTNNQMDKLARQNPQATWLQRRGLESILGMGGAMFGGIHGGYEGGVGGGLLGYLGGKAAAELYLNKLASPERMLQRAINPKPVTPIPFTGQVVQPVAQSLISGGGTAF